MESDHAQLLQEAVDKAKQDPGTLDRILHAYFETKSTQSIRFYLNDDVDTLCMQPGNRPKLIQIAVDKAKEDPSSVPAEHANDLQAYFQSQSTQFICSYITNRPFIPATSQLQMAPVLIPMVHAQTGHYYDFADVVMLHDQYGARVEPNSRGVTVHGNRNVRLLDTTLDTDFLELHWLIDTVTDQGKALAHEWGHEMFEQKAWLDALQGMKDVQVESSELYKLSNRHRPLNMDATPQAMVETARFQQQSSQEQNNVWPTQRADGSYMLPISVADARLLLENFELARLAMEAGAPVPLDVLNSFLADESFRSMDTDGQSQDRKMQEAVMVYMWDQTRNFAADEELMHVNTVESRLRSRRLNELLDDYFYTGGRRPVWLKYVSHELKAAQPQRYSLQNIANPSPAVQLAAVTQNGTAIQHIRNPSPELQQAAVEQTGYAIEYIDNPSPELQQAAVTQNGHAIRRIRNPSPAVQLAAVQQNGTAIQYITNPTPEVQLAAVQQNPVSIHHVTDPVVQVAAVQANPVAIRYITNPTPEVQMAAVQQNRNAINWIRNPAPEVLATGGDLDPDNIRNIQSPSYEAQMVAIRADPSNIQYIQNPDWRVQLEAVQANAHNIRNIRNPDGQAQVAAVRADPSNIQYIQNPIHGAQIRAVRLDPNVIQYIRNPTPEVLRAVMQANSRRRQ